MIGGRGRLLGAGTAASFGIALTAAAALAEPLEPYQMVRSLQFVQDDIAGGDHAALPMQRKLLELIDQRLRTTGNEEFEDPRNFRALLVYGMSGGNPRTLEVVLSRLGPGAPDAATASGVLAYLVGNTQAALAALGQIDPMAEKAEIAAFLALVKGTVLGGQDAKAGMVFLDQARLLGAGTLVEEAALRRTIALSVPLGDPDRFLRASSQYARRFLRSPYAAQFADSFVEGILGLHETLDRKAVAEIISEMSPDHQESIYLRLARAGTVDGLTELTTFAAGKARELGSPDIAVADPRAVLYSGIASITGETIDQTAERLKALDRNRLSASDRKLLDAALAIAAEVLAAPDSALTGATDAVPPPGERGGSHLADGQVSASATAAADTVEAVLEDTRNRLKAIDTLLKETGK